MNHLAEAFAQSDLQGETQSSPHVTETHENQTPPSSPSQQGRGSEEGCKQESVLKEERVNLALTELQTSSYYRGPRFESGRDRGAKRDDAHVWNAAVEQQTNPNPNTSAFSPPLTWCHNK